MVQREAGPSRPLISRGRAAERSVPSAVTSRYLTRVVSQAMAVGDFGLERLTNRAKAALEEELALCERRIALLRELIGSGGVPARRTSATSGQGRPNAGIHRCLLEAVRTRPGIGVDALTNAMAEKGFVGTCSRPLRGVVAHEMRALVRTGLVTQCSGRTFAPVEEL
jgi:hypothetical protein